MSFSWDEVLDGATVDPGTVKAGTYKAKVAFAQAKVASTGNPMISVKFEVVEEGPYKSGEVWTNIVMSSNPNARRFWLSKLSGLGMTVEWLAANKPTPEQIAATLDGTNPVAMITVKDSTDPDYPNPDIAKITRIDGETATPGQAKPAGVPNIPKPGVPNIPKPNVQAPAPAPAPAPSPDVNGQEEPF